MVAVCQPFIKLMNSFVQLHEMRWNTGMEKHGSDSQEDTAAVLRL